MESDRLPRTEYSSFAISLLAVLTPFAAVPPFLSLTAGLPSTECSRVATVAAITAALVLVVSALLGGPILTTLGASMDSLRVGGGLVVLLMALSTPDLHRAPSHRGAEPTPTPIVQRPSGAIVPLCLPLLAGPGAISTVIAERRHGTGLGHDALVIACILSTCAAAWALLRLSQPIGKHLGSSGLIVMSRLVGLLTAAIAVEIISDGLRALFPILG
jgi:multiple antibiotic resistance protein